MRERLINRRQQGDLGEASAIEWLTSKGFCVWTPLGHSPDVDLLAQSGDRLRRVQVKTTTCVHHTSTGEARWTTMVATNGGNQSWTGVTKNLDPSTFDYLFVLVGDGRRWLIPSSSVETIRGVTLGGTRYSECEIEPGQPILEAVYGGDATLSPIARPNPGERRSGRAGPDCKFGASVLSGFESLLPHSPSEPPSYERKLGRSGQAIVRSKRQMTLPWQPFDDAGLSIGDRIRFRADGPGRIVLERIDPPPG